MEECRVGKTVAFGKHPKRQGAKRPEQRKKNEGAAKALESKNIWATFRHGTRRRNSWWKTKFAMQKTFPLESHCEMFVSPKGTINFSYLLLLLLSTSLCLSYDEDNLNFPHNGFKDESWDNVHEEVAALRINHSMKLVSQTWENVVWAQRFCIFIKRRFQGWLMRRAVALIVAMGGD